MITRAEILLALARADGQTWTSIIDATEHTAEMMYGKQADAIEAIVARARRGALHQAAQLLGREAGFQEQDAQHQPPRTHRRFAAHRVAERMRVCERMVRELGPMTYDDMTSFAQREDGSLLAGLMGDQHQRWEQRHGPLGDGEAATQRIAHEYGPQLATADDVIARRARYADTPGGHADRRTKEQEQRERDIARTTLLHAMEAESEARWCASWMINLDRILHAEAGHWEALARAGGWPLGYRGEDGWVSWREAGAHYRAQRQEDREGLHAHKEGDE